MGNMIFEAPYEYRGVTVPGLPILPFGVERHPIPGGGSRAVIIHKGDEISLFNREGLQKAEMVFFSNDGISDAGMLDTKGGQPIAGLLDSLASDASGAKVKRKLHALRFDLSVADGIHVFDSHTLAGACENFHISCDGLILVCAPGRIMRPEEQDTSSEIILYIKRAHPKKIKGNLKPPSPLADALLDSNIQPGEAYTYEVSAGQFIQILDVQGRECSDFQAFSRRSLDQGKERDIDPTTTRSLSGQLYPTPGLLSKFFSVDHEPLVEIVQDSCGRHDTFNLACTARYYEDLGYPGHLNCSDNINAQLSRFDVHPRAGWPAINFFFNTNIDATNAIGMDEPWSRPGDFVLLRALTDLVCVSTGCPCDVDPANGWDPSDIQVRLYKDNETFKPSLGWRKTTGADMEETKNTAFHDCFARHTRDFVEYNGFWLAQEMTHHGAVAEYWGCREKAAIMDLSPLRKFEVTGPDAGKLMNLCMTRDMSKLSTGQIVYTAMCYEDSGMIDDGTVFRLGDDNFRWVGGNDESGLWLRKNAETHNLSAWVRSSTEQLCNLALQGPLSRDILKPLFWTAPKNATIEELEWFRFTIARLGDFNGPACVISRTGYTGELGYEIFCHPKDAEAIFDAIWEQGKPLGLVPLGLGALDMLRIEAGLVFSGYEFCNETDPFEAGIGFTVPLKSKSENFIGRKVLEERKARPQRKLIGLDIEGGVVPVNGDSVHIGKEKIGIITSAVKSPILNKVIALARVTVLHSAFGTKVEIGQLDGDQKRLKALICPFPHFDPKKERVKGIYP